MPIATTRSRRRFVKWLVAPCVAATVAWFVFVGRGERLPGDLTAWRVGQTYTYAFDLDSRVATTFSVGPQSRGASVRTDIGGRLEISIASVTDSAVFQVWRFVSIEDGSITAGDQTIAENTALRRRLIGPELVVELGLDGAIRWLHREKSTDDLFAGVAELLVAESAITRRSRVSEWTTQEQAHVGLVETRYSARDGALVRERIRYRKIRALPFAASTAKQSLESRATIRLRSDAMPSRFTSEEQLTVHVAEATPLTETRQHLDLRLVDDRVAVGARAVLKDRRPVAIGTPRDDAESERAALVQQAGDVDRAKLLRYLRSGQAATIGSSGNEMLWRSVGLLRLDPDSVDAIAETIGADDISFDTRMFAFAALAGTGHPRAQKAITEMLSSKWARADLVARRRLLQQLSFVAKPTRESAEFLTREIKTAEAEQRFAAAYSLGSVARKIGERGERDLAAQFEQHLVDELEAADDDETRARMITALGNAGSEARVDTIASYSADDSAEVRAAVAGALKRTPTDRAGVVAVKLIGDPSARVQRSALNTVERWHPNQELTRRVGERIIAAGSPSVHIEALPLVRRISDIDLRRRVLEHMLATVEIDKRLIGELRAEMAKLGPS